MRSFAWCTRTPRKRPGFPPIVGAGRERSSPPAETTEEECIAARDPEFFVNCYQVVEFCPDGTAALMLTDILDPGTYARGDAVIETTWQGASGAPPEVTFTVVSPTELVDDAYDLTWTLDEENVHALTACD